MKKINNKYEAMVDALQHLSKMDIPIKINLNRWAEWTVIVCGQKFKNKDVCLAVADAIKLVMKIKNITL